LVYTAGIMALVSVNVIFIQALEFGKHR